MLFFVCLFVCLCGSHVTVSVVFAVVHVNIKLKHKHAMETFEASEKEDADVYFD